MSSTTALLVYTRLTTVGANAWYGATEEAVSWVRYATPSPLPRSVVWNAVLAVPVILVVTTTVLHAIVITITAQLHAIVITHDNGPAPRDRRYRDRDRR